MLMVSLLGHHWVSMTVAESGCGIESKAPDESWNRRRDKSIAN